MKTQRRCWLAGLPHCRQQDCKRRAHVQSFDASALQSVRHVTRQRIISITPLSFCKRVHSLGSKVPDAARGLPLFAILNRIYSDRIELLGHGRSPPLGLCPHKTCGHTRPAWQEVTRPDTLVHRQRHMSKGWISP
jgi:hypothetical protein